MKMRNKEKIKSFFRHLATFGGAILVSKGVVDDKDVEAIIGGGTALMALILALKNKHDLLQK